MGEVYRAIDSRLGRAVAIKILGAGLADKTDAQRRFVREARAIAALSHPNICAIHDVGHQVGVDFLVLEYLDGGTLASRIARASPLPLDETIHIAVQIADALTAAHRAGIIHRDLKPGNVMLTKTGVKVLDFGLAKLLGADRATALSSAETAFPTSEVTRMVGTLPYMAPEQIEGRSIDARSDLFAFGAIVYEMATGKRAFQGMSNASLAAAILERTPPPITDVQPLTPPVFERLVQKCLAKDPEARWQSASDVADELRWIAARSGSGATPQPVRGRRHLSRWVAITGGLIMALAAGAGIWKWRGAGHPGPPEVQHRQVTFAGDVVGAAISPDGRSLAYVVGDQGTEIRVLVRDLTGGQMLPIWTGEYLWAVDWMPEGSHVMMSGLQQRSSGTWIAPRLGGSTRRVLDLAGLGASSPDGKTLAMTQSSRMGFDVISLENSDRRTVKMTGFRWLAALDWHARTNRIVLLTIDDDRVWSIWSVAPDGQEQTRLLANQGPIHAICSSPISDVVYALRARGDTSDLVRTRVGMGADSADVLLTGLPIIGGETQIYRCTVSADGRRLIYTRAARHANLWRLNLARATEATTLTQGTPQLAVPKVSPDGQWIAARRGPESDPEVVKIPIGGGEPVGLGEGTMPAWSADGQCLAFVSRRSGSARVWVARADGVRPEEVKDSAVGSDLAWLPDGRLVWQTPGNRNYRIRDLRTGRDEYLVKDDSAGFVFQPRFSPRGDQVAVYWNRRGNDPTGMWLLSWPGREERRLTAEMLGPIGWSADGEWIYAAPPTGRAIFRVSTRTGKTERVGQFPVGNFESDACDLTPDRSAIICSLIEQKNDAWLMENFDPEIPTSRADGES
jgi:Tol biopolymer transport system component